MKLLFSFQFPAYQHTEAKPRSNCRLFKNVTSQYFLHLHLLFFFFARRMSFQYGCCYCCCPKRFALLMLSLLCTIIILTEQAVAYVVQPPTATASLSHIPLNESLVEILPRANTSNSSIELLAASGQERSLNRLLMNSLTPGQQVINAVPYNGKF